MKNTITSRQKLQIRLLRVSQDNIKHTELKNINISASQQLVPVKSSLIKSSIE
jgi:hypothetical protein